MWVKLCKKRCYWQFKGKRTLSTRSTAHFFWKHREAISLKRTAGRTAAAMILLKQSETWLLFLRRLIHKSWKNTWTNQSKWIVPRASQESCKHEVITEKEGERKSQRVIPKTMTGREDSVSHLFTQHALGALQTVFTSQGDHDNTNTYQLLVRFQVSDLTSQQPYERGTLITFIS